MSRLDAVGRKQDVRQRFWGTDLMKKTVVLALLFPLLLVPLLRAQKFYPDDPLERDPAPLSVEDANYRKLNDY